MRADRQTQEQLYRRLKLAGATPYITGGAVRDHLLKRTVKDTDVVVFGMSPDILTHVLSEFGQVLTYGKSFRVYQVRGLNLEFSLPRNGGDPGVAGEEAIMKLDAQGRDFTINALYMDPLTGIIKDPLNGLEDLDKKQLRQASATSFTQDPLRVLRAVQLSCRLGLALSPGAREAMTGVSLEKVATERVYEELAKWLMSPAPGTGWGMLRETGHVPDLCFKKAASNGIGPYPAKWDQVLADTLDQGAKLRGGSLHPLSFMWGLLLYGCGLWEKNETTPCPDRDWHTEKIQSFRRVSNNQQHTDVLSALLWGLIHVDALSHRGPDVARLSLGVDLDELQLALKSLTPIWHHTGMMPAVTTTVHRLQRLRPTQVITPLVSGSDLKEWGYTAGKEMGLLLEIAFQMQLEGVNRDTLAEYFKKQRTQLEKLGRKGQEYATMERMNQLP